MLIRVNDKVIKKRSNQRHCIFTNTASYGERERYGGLLGTLQENCTKLKICQKTLNLKFEFSELKFPKGKNFRLFKLALDEK